MTNNNETNDITIRAVSESDALALGKLHNLAYRSRFFDPDMKDRNGNAYGAPLARDFPVLAEGQNETYFCNYWQKFVKNLDVTAARERNYAFAAFRGDEPVAFVKGDGLPVSEDADMKRSLSAIFLDAAQCGELGSVYCAPQAKYKGLGRSLTALFADRISRLGYRGMITRAYAKNDSPAFFEKLGARFMGECEIPNEYLDRKGRIQTVPIPGVWLYWDEKALNGLASRFRP